MNYKGDWSNIKLEELIEEPIPDLLDEEIIETVENCDFCGDPGPLEQILSYDTVFEVCKQCKGRM